MTKNAQWAIWQSILAEIRCQCRAMVACKAKRAESAARAALTRE